MRILRSGEQYEIVRGNQRAVVTGVGATLRRYAVGDREMVTTFPEDALPGASQGQQLLPWPNRIRDGRYEFGGETHQLPINELDRHNALHGLASWVTWELADLYPTSVMLRTVLHPRPGWPGTLACAITHTLTEDGLLVEVAATNAGDTPCPFGYAAHPYISVPGGLDRAEVTMPFETQVLVDERLLPVATAPVAGSDVDITGRLLGDTVLDTPYTDPARDADGRWRVRVRDVEAAATLWADEHFDWLQIFTSFDRRALAVEPATCGPDAFNEGPTHGGLIVLQPGETFRGEWGITPD